MVKPLNQNAAARQAPLLPDGISAARAGALFVSALQPSEEPSARQARQAIAAALGQFGHRGCAEQVAQEFGEHPDLAAARMR